MNQKPLKIGILGFGVVGQGLMDILNYDDWLDHEILLICDKDPEPLREVPQGIPTTQDINDLLSDERINLYVELTDDEEDGYRFVTEALIKGVPVVTANKRMVANHMTELVRIQREQGVSLLYEASSCSSIPIIRTMEEFYDNALLDSVSGIINGSSNYILSRIFKDDIDFDIALKQAQDLGFAETDPYLDLAGYDALYKLCILNAHAYGVFVPPDDILHHGIQNLSRHDIQYAREKGCRIKLIAVSRKVGTNAITMYVLPQFVRESNQFYIVENENNCVMVEAPFSGKQFFIGKGAGGYPTGSAVFSDITATGFHYRYDYKKYHKQHALTYTKDAYLKVYLRYYEEKNLSSFQFKRITDRHYGAEFNYVIGWIRIEELYKVNEKLNTADVLLVVLEDQEDETDW